MTDPVVATLLEFGAADVPCIQNLGPDPIYFGRTADVDNTTGVKLDAGEGFTFDATLSDSGWTGVWVYASGTSDVRALSIG
jgi:hypothetical protein